MVAIPGKESEVTTMLSEEIQPMFRPTTTDVKRNKKNEPSSLTKWLVALLIGAILLVILSVL